MARLVTLDATNTCMKVTRSVGYHYARVAKDYGVILNEEDVNKEFKLYYKRADSLFPCFGSLHSLTSKQWWIKVIDDTLSNSGVKDQDIRSRIGEHLFEDFSGGRNWHLYPDVVPSLQHIKSTGAILGVISNFDDRLFNILSSLGIARYFDFILSSYEVSFAKPDIRIFKIALETANVEASMAIHIGDNYDLDYIASKKAGMKGMLLVRDKEKQVSKQNLEDKFILSSLIELQELNFS